MNYVEKSIGEISELLEKSNGLDERKEALERARDASEVFELLAKVGEAEILRRLMVLGEGSGTIPLVTVRVDDIDGTKQAVIKIEDEPRRLVMDEDGVFSWYNAEGPEE